MVQEEIHAHFDVFMIFRDYVLYIYSSDKVFCYVYIAKHTKTHTLYEYLLINYNTRGNFKDIFLYIISIIIVFEFRYVCFMCVCV